MEQEEYTEEYLLEEMKKDQHLLNEGADNFNAYLNSHISTVEYKSSKNRKKRAIICSYRPMIEFYLSGLGWKKSRIRVELNKLNTRRTESCGDAKHVVTYCFLMKEPRTLPIDGIHILSTLRLCEDNIDQIKDVCKKVSKAWNTDRALLKRFS